MYSVPLPSSRMKPESTVIQTLSIIAVSCAIIVAPVCLSAAYFTDTTETRQAAILAAWVCAAVIFLTFVFVVAGHVRETARLKAIRAANDKYRTKSDSEYALRKAKGDNKALEELDAALAA